MVFDSDTMTSSLSLTRNRIKKLFRRIYLSAIFLKKLYHAGTTVWLWLSRDCHPVVNVRMFYFSMGITCVTWNVISSHSGYPVPSSAKFLLIAWENECVQNHQIAGTRNLWRNAFDFQAFCIYFGAVDSISCSISRHHRTSKPSWVDSKSVHSRG